MGAAVECMSRPLESSRGESVCCSAYMYYFFADSLIRIATLRDSEVLDVVSYRLLLLNWSWSCFFSYGPHRVSAWMVYFCRVSGSLFFVCDILVCPTSPTFLSCRTPVQFGFRISWCLRVFARLCCFISCGQAF